MCFGERERAEYDRRRVMGGIAASLAAATLAAPRPALGQARAVTTAMVDIPGRDIVLRAHLARPRDNGRHPLVVIAHGNAGLPPDIVFAAYYLAQAGFAALVYDWGSRAPMPSDPAEREAWGRRLFKNEFVGEQIADLDAAASFLRRQDFAAGPKIGLVGFCGGGRLALLSATRLPNVGAVVSLYGPVDYRERLDAEDPVPNILDVAADINVPVQGHYGLNDAVARPDDARRFERAMRGRRRTIEMFYYAGAGHSFCNYLRPAGSDPGYDFHAEACDLAYQRAVRFLRRHL